MLEWLEARIDVQKEDSTGINIGFPQAKDSQDWKRFGLAPNPVLPLGDETVDQTLSWAQDGTNLQKS